MTIPELEALETLIIYIGVFVVTAVSIGAISYLIFGDD